MTRDGMCGVFIPDRVLAGRWRSQWKASDQEWAGRCTTGCGRGRSYFIHLPMKMELIEGSEMSAISIVTLGNYPKENILHTGHGESLKSRNFYYVILMFRATCFYPYWVIFRPF